MINKRLQENLKERFNPEGSSLRRAQLRMLEMLKYIDRICVANNISYWLSSGSCLGAVRHGGFIPWDDDVDIEMFEEDYKKLCRVLKSQKNPKYILQDYNIDDEYTYTFAKLRDLTTIIHEPSGDDRWFKYQGCFIDIFPLSPSNSEKLFIFSAKLWRLTVVYLAKINNSRLRRFLLKISYVTNTKIVFPILQFISSINNKDVFRHRLGIGFKGKRFYQDISTTKRVKFEDTYFPIPGNADNYLKELFGDYKKLPDLTKLHCHTNEFIFLK